MRPRGSAFAAAGLAPARAAIPPHPTTDGMFFQISFQKLKKNLDTKSIFLK